MLIAGSLMVVLDITILSVAIGHLAGEFDAPLPKVQWAVTGYTLALAGAIPTTAWSVARWGSKRVYLAAVAIFAGKLVARRRVVEPGVTGRFPDSPRPRVLSADPGGDDDRAADRHPCHEVAMALLARLPVLIGADPRAPPWAVAARHRLVAVDFGLTVPIGLLAPVPRGS